MGKLIQDTSLRISTIQFRQIRFLKYFASVFFITFVALQFIVIDTLEGWPKETEQDVAKYILPDENTTIIFPKLLKKSSNKRLDILIIVSSDPQRSDRRDSIRRTWGHDQNSGLKTSLIFLVGLRRDSAIDNLIYQESEKHGDILLEKFYESYLNLTIKSLMLVKFAATYKLNADFVFKVNYNLLTTWDTRNLLNGKKSNAIFLMAN